MNTRTRFAICSALEVDAAKFLPADDSTAGFDNMAGTLAMSPALLEAYLSAAGKISRLALGTARAPTQTVYRVPEDATQNYHVEGLPFGTRGGMLVKHEFPADGEYMFKVIPVNKGNMGSDTPFGEVRGEKLEVLRRRRARAALRLGQGRIGRRRGDGVETSRVPDHRRTAQVGVTFLATNYAPRLDLNQRIQRSTIETGGLPGYTFYPARRQRPHRRTVTTRGAGDTPSRSKIFICQPRRPRTRRPCARQICRHARPPRLSAAGARRATSRR